MAEIVVALDLPTPVEALALCDRLPGLRWAKLGPGLVVQDGPGLLRELVAREVRVFLDLKWHDIPDTVAAAARAAAQAGVALATAHALGGPEMIRAACAAAGRMRLAAVTVLTSHDAPGYAEAVGRPDVAAEDEVARLARLALAAGAAALVASPREARRLRDLAGPDVWIVTPGIRLPGAALHDQRRTATAGEAVAAGATHLVVGRPITGADDPAGVYQDLCDAIQRPQQV